MKYLIVIAALLASACTSPTAPTSPKPRLRGDARITGYAVYRDGHPKMAIPRP